MFGIKTSHGGKRVSYKERHSWNNNHGWKKVSEIEKNIIGIIPWVEKSTFNKEDHSWNEKHG